MQLSQTPQQGALIQQIAAIHMQDHAQIGGGIAQAVDRRYGRNNDRVRTLEQRLGRRQSHLLDMVVDRSILLDKGIRGGNIGLRLVIVVVGNEIFYRVVRKELAKLTIQLGGQGLVRSHDDGRTLHLLNHVGDGKGLARAGDTQQRLM